MKPRIVAFYLAQVFLIYVSQCAQIDPDLARRYGLAPREPAKPRAVLVDYREVDGICYAIHVRREFDRTNGWSSRPPLPKWTLIEGNVISVTAEGVLVSRNNSSEPVFIERWPGKPVDGDRVVQYVFRSGDYKYTAVGGAAKTVEKFIIGRPLTVEEANQIMAQARKPK